MNYLAHLYLAGDDDAEITGALLGDFVKGPLEKIALPEDIVDGIQLHRAIDSFTDTHPIVERSKQRLASRGLVAGIIVDVVYDHYLVNHWEYFTHERFDAFTHYRYERLLTHLDMFPAPMRKMVPLMCEHDWLGAYGHIENVALALERIGKRLSRPGLLDNVKADLIQHYQGLEEDFFDFFPAVIAQHARQQRIDSAPHLPHSPIITSAR
ncbi:MAG TPA: ACP phosphodiesterase [Alcanivoracaceae bacterium]|nr:ACP phosphodiesterase [Alcanivoracaceae bacterium]